MLAVTIAVVLAAIACNELEHYDILCFFFDGVPRPGERKETGYAIDPSIQYDQRPDAAGTTATRRPRYAHAPYRDADCTACHDLTSGQLVATVEDGLCARCHRDVPGNATYVHGPVAVNECLFCHHFHASVHPHILQDEATQVCLRCHAEEDLGDGPHHENAVTDGCSQCHDAHGGADRFFLRPNAK